MNIVYDTFPTDLGQFSIAVDESGAVVATTFGTFKSSAWRRDPAAVRHARKQVQEFLSGRRRAFALPIAAEGTAFQRKVWSALARIPFGTTASYGEIARQLGNPKASRAVGSANGANPVCVIVPCHRVIAADGSLGGFAFGLETKRKLLGLEGVRIGP